MRVIWLRGAWICVLSSLESMCELHPRSHNTNNRGDNISLRMCYWHVKCIRWYVPYLMCSPSETQKNDKNSTTQQFPHHDVSMKIYTISSCFLSVACPATSAIFLFPFAKHKVIRAPINVSQINRMRQDKTRWKSSEIKGKLARTYTEVITY